MPKSYLILILFSLCLALTFAQDAQIEMTQWLRYTHAYNTDTLKTTLTTKRFSLDRGYIRLNYKYNDNLRLNFTADLYTSDKFADGAGLKLKDGFLRISNLLPVPNLDLNIGLQKTYFSRIYDWEYQTVEKAYTDKNKVIASADYGVSLTGILPKGFGQYNFGLYNGEGYTKVGKSVNTEPGLTADLRLLPFTGLTLGGSIFYEKENQALHTYRAGVIGGDTLVKGRLAYAPFLKLALFGIFSVEGEYIKYTYNRVHTDTAGGEKVEKKKEFDLGGFWVMPMIKVLPLKLELIGRFDIWNQKEDGKKVDKKSYQTLILGLNYYPFGRNIVFQFNWQREKYKDKAVPTQNIFYLQVKGSWQKTISQ